MITVLAGGTGSVKLVRGLVAQEKKVNVISNVGDNYWLYGLYVCPDIDTIIYGLADLRPRKRLGNQKRHIQLFTPDGSIRRRDMVWSWRQRCSNTFD